MPYDSPETLNFPPNGGDQWTWVYWNWKF